MDTKIDLEGIDLDTYSSADVDDHSSSPPVYGLMNNGEDDITDKHEESTKEESHDKGSGTGRSWLPFLSVEYYQSYFDVTTSDVFRRVVAGMAPFPYNLVSVISSSPDLYGPFWLCMTLIFAISISGNLSALFSSISQWEFHFHEVVVIATVIYSYTWCLPVVLWLFFVWRNSSDRYSLIMLQSIYGYSMGVFIPLTLLWVINVEALRWLMLVIAIVLSGIVLVQSLWKPLRNETKQIAMAVVGCVLILHSGIAIGFKFYYFGSSLAPETAPLVHQIPLPPSASGPTPILSHDPTTTPTTAIAATEIMISHSTDTVIRGDVIEGTDNKGGVANRGDDPNGGGVTNRGDSNRGDVVNRGGDPNRGGVVNRGGDPNRGGVTNRGGDPNRGGNRGDINGDSNGGVIGRGDSTLNSSKAPPNRRDSIEGDPLATQSDRPKDDSRPTDVPVTPNRDQTKPTTKKQ